MAVGSLPPAPFDPSAATPYGDNFYPKQDDPNRTIIPSRPAPPTPSNLWAAIRITTLNDYLPSSLGQIPCMRSSLLQGIAGGVGFAVVRLLVGQPGRARAFSSISWFFYSFTVIGGTSNLLCNQRRARELETVRLISERFPERNIANMARAIDPSTGEVLLTPPTPRRPRSSPSSSAEAGEAFSSGGGGDGKNYVEVRDAEGNVVGRVGKKAAGVAMARGATESFGAVEEKGQEKSSGGWKSWVGWK